ncbi:hypothetical protein GTO27_09325 [Candidatus Bathyarchaeota archaeon]|nr:hypothetical protein [Candidatus Bathyarchaeota archaeon]
MKKLESWQKFRRRMRSVEKTLIRHNLLEKAINHEDVSTCPLCNEGFFEGDRAVFYIGPMHRRCFDKLKKGNPENP